MFISALFWLLHTWVLDPMPNAFKRKEFLRYRRELLYVTSKLNFRSPAREVRALIQGGRGHAGLWWQWLLAGVAATTQ